MAVFTQLTKNDVRMMLAGYDLGRFVRLQGIPQGVENSNFHLFTDGQGHAAFGVNHYILTVFEGRTDLSALPFYFAWMDYVRGHGVHCPQIMAARSGETVATVRGKSAAILSFLPGRGVDDVDITLDLCGQMGALVARLHTCGDHFHVMRPNSVSWPYWQKIAILCRLMADSVSLRLRDIIDTEIEFIRSSLDLLESLPRGVVHADLFPDNIFIDERGQLSGVIDFYFSCTDAYVYDLAITFNAWCFDLDHVYDPQRGSAFLEAYQNHRRLTEVEKSAFQIAARAAALRFLLSRLYDLTHRPLGAVVLPKDPLEYLKKLQFHQKNKVF